jgi:hypothetical protein
VQYNWTVTACDSYGDCNTSTTSNFTIASVVSFDLFINVTDFGTMTLGQNNHTVNGNPAPLTGRNNGNVKLNATINATALFNSVPLNIINYMYAAADNESGSIVQACSNTTFTPINTTQKPLFCLLNFSDAYDETKIHINITIPPDEPPSTIRQSLVQVVAIKGE